MGHWAKDRETDNWGEHGSLDRKHGLQQQEFRQQTQIEHGFQQPSAGCTAVAAVCLGFSVATPGGLLH